MKFKRFWCFGVEQRLDETDFVSHYVGENGVKIDLIPLDSVRNAYSVTHDGYTRNFSYLAQAKEYVASIGGVE